MEATENVQATDNGIENAETSEEVKVQKSDESLSENNKPDKAEGEQSISRYWTIFHDDVTWPAAYFYVADMLYRQFGMIAPSKSAIRP